MTHYYVGSGGVFWRRKRETKWRRVDDASGTMTRLEHLAWAKQRALELLPERVDLAIASFTSDLAKHPDTAGRAMPTGVDLSRLVTASDNALALQSSTTIARVRAYIEKFD